jgi:hypothetical protein
MHPANSSPRSRYRFCLAIEFPNVQACLGLPVFQSFWKKGLPSTEAVLQVWELVPEEKRQLFPLNLISTKVHPGMELGSGCFDDGTGLRVAANVQRERHVCI